MSPLSTPVTNADVKATPGPVRALAEYLTAGRVVHHSIGLQMSGRALSEAQEFFDLREAFGVSGYVTADQAETAIRAAILKATGEAP